MAAATATTPEHNTTAGGTDRPHSSKQQQHRRLRLLSHLHIHVPVPAGSGWSGRPSGPASAPPCSAHAPAHQDRPASPSLLRSPTAWIRSKGHGLGSSKHHTPRRPGAGSFRYDARSYAQNFDEGGREEDAVKQHRYLSPGLLVASPRQVSPSTSPPSSQGGVSGGGGSSNGEEAARETLVRVME